MFWIKNIGRLLICLVFFILGTSLTLAVSSDNYNLRDFSFGAGGGTTNSNSYGIEGVAGEVEKGKPESNSYGMGLGLSFIQQANVPEAPTVTNPANYYNKLKVVVNTSNNPSDSLYLITASTDNFASNTQYVQSDNTLGASAGIGDWQSYAAWGGGSGFNLIGLSPGTTYTFKVAAMQGNYTQTGFGPTASAATINATLSYDIDVSSSDSETSAPYILNIGTLTPGTVATSTNKIWVDLSTNASNGGLVYVYSSNAGLTSTKAGYTISAASTNLSSAGSGYGARSNSVSESSGGPMQPLSPYSGSGDNVGVLDSGKRLIYDSSGAPVTSGRVSFELKAKANATTPAATDYADTLTVVVAGSF